jgi:hypothetical protein
MQTATLPKPAPAPLPSGSPHARHLPAATIAAPDFARASSTAPLGRHTLLRDGPEVDQLDRLWRQRAALCVEARAIPVKDDAAYAANFERRSAIEDQIEAMPPTVGTIAALAMIALHRDGDSGDTCHAGPTGVLHSMVRVLEHVRPHLTGLVAVHAAELLDADVETPVSKMAFWA